MNRPSPFGLRVAAGLALAVSVTLTAACGASTPSGASQQGHQPRFDQSLHDQLPQSVRDRGVLRVGTDASYPPMSSFGPDGRTIIGMEPDLGADIGRVLGVRVQFVRTEFTGLLPAVVAGHLDLAMAAITDTPERAKKVDFVNYFSAGTAIVVRHGNPAGVTDIKDLCGKVVAVETGTTQVDLLARAQKNCLGRPIVVKVYNTNSDALVKLRTGRAVAVLNDLSPAIFLVDDPRTRSQYQLASNTQYEPALYGIAVPRSQPGLRDALQGACEELLHTGSYDDVLAHWGVANGAVTRVSINSDR